MITYQRLATTIAYTLISMQLANLGVTSNFISGNKDIRSLNEAQLVATKDLASTSFSKEFTPPDKPPPRSTGGTGTL